MSASHTETETESGSPDQQPECVFDVDDLDIPDSVRENYDLEEWECSRPVWEEASGNRCVWHTSDGQIEEKPHAELEETVDHGDLHGSAATGVDLSGIDFPVETGFIDADLSDARLSYADLSEARLSYADLPDANLYDADLSEATLEDADLSSTADLGITADLRSADLSEADLEDADLSGAYLRDADLSGAYLYDADLSGAGLPDADLSGANLYDADLPEANLKYADLSEAELGDADLSGANLYDADLSEATLTFADLSEATLEDADLPEAKLRFADLSEEDLDNADLSGARLVDADLSEATLEDADLSEADLRSADLSGADFREIQFSDVTANQATTVGKTRSDFSTADEYDKLAKGYHNLKTALSEEGLSQRARQARTLERQARTHEARKRFQREVKEKMKHQIKSVRQFRSRSGDNRMQSTQSSSTDLGIGSSRNNQILTQFTTWIGGVLSRLLTGYGTRPTFVLGWTGLILLLTTVWFELGPVPSDLEGGPLYYSVVTFVTSPPHPIQEVGEVGMITEIIVLLETYIGTTLIVLLGYVLGNRERV